MADVVWNSVTRPKFWRGGGGGPGGSPNEERPKKASELLVALVPPTGSAEVKVDDLVAGLKDRAYGIVLLLFALPNCVPLPPGLSALFGLPLFFFGYQMVRGYEKPWLPKVLSQKRFDRARIAGVMARAASWLRRVEHLIRPRFNAMTTRSSERFIGLAVVLFAASISIPFPLTNFLPALGIAVLALGLMVKDGVAVTIGLAIGFGGISVTLSVVLFAGYVAAAVF